MASPQVEKGYTRIANEFMQALAQCRLTSYEWQVAMMIMRMTWGYQVKKKKISYAYLSKHTNISRRNVIRAVKSLNEKVIVGLKREEGAKALNEMWINKDYALWKGVSNNTNKSVSVNTHKGVSPDTTYKEINKQIIIKKMDEFRNKDWGMN